MNQSERNERHDRELRKGSDRDVHRTRHENAEVILREGHAHREHDEAKDRRLHVPPHPTEHRGKEERDHGYCGDEGRRLPREKRGDSDQLLHAV